MVVAVADTVAVGKGRVAVLGSAVTVEVSVPSANIDIMNVPLFPDVGDIGASVTMAKEGF